MIIVFKIIQLKEIKKAVLRTAFLISFSKDGAKRRLCFLVKNLFWVFGCIDCVVTKQRRDREASKEERK